MGRAVEEGLRADLWMQEMRHLAAQCSRKDEDFVERAIRKAYHLSIVRPWPMRTMCRPSVTEEELERLLETGRLEQAVLEVTGDLGTFSISPSPLNGRVVAELSLDRGGKLSAGGNSPTLAILAAWAAFLGGRVSH